jgi:hypothetical protein
LRTSEKPSEPTQSAEQRFRDAFERLKLCHPEVLPKGTPVSQNNVAREAGCDPSALRKSRFPLLVMEIQEWVESHKSDQASVGRQKLLRQQRKNRDAREIIADLKKQRDSAANLLVDANHRIVELTYELNAARARLDAARSSAPVIDLPKRK